MEDEIRDYCKEYNLCWNVYTYNINSKKIEKYNIFNHGGFRKDVNNMISKKYVLHIFETELKTSLMYYFWSKSEWEIVLKPWIEYDVEIKIDVYDQVVMNWDNFFDYVSVNVIDKLIN